MSRYSSYLLSLFTARCTLPLLPSNHFQFTIYIFFHTLKIIHLSIHCFLFLSICELSFVAVPLNPNNELFFRLFKSIVSNFSCRFSSFSHPPKSFRAGRMRSRRGEGVLVGFISGLVRSDVRTIWRTDLWLMRREKSRICSLTGRTLETSEGKLGAFPRNWIWSDRLICLLSVFNFFIFFVSRGKFLQYVVFCSRVSELKFL